MSRWDTCCDWGPMCSGACLSRLRQVRKTPRAKEADVPSTTSGSSSPSRPVMCSPSKPRASSSGGEEGPELQQVMREVRACVSDPRPSTHEPGPPSP